MPQIHDFFFFIINTHAHIYKQMKKYVNTAFWFHLLLQTYTGTRVWVVHVYVCACVFKAEYLVLN